jgi:hypothetical protein
LNMAIACKMFLFYLVYYIYIYIYIRKVDRNGRVTGWTADPWTQVPRKSKVIIQSDQTASRVHPSFC